MNIKKSRVTLDTTLHLKKIQSGMNIVEWTPGETRANLTALDLANIDVTREKGHSWPSQEYIFVFPDRSQQSATMVGICNVQRL